MKNIFKYLKKYWLQCILVLVLLVVQAFCDLALPDYTSKIVDTGIQNNGVASVAPEVISQSDFDKLGIFLKESEISYIKKFYKKTNSLNGIDIPIKNNKNTEFYVLNTNEEKDLKALDNTFIEAMVAVYAIDNVTREQFDKMAKEAGQSLSTYQNSLQSTQSSPAEKDISSVPKKSIDENQAAVQNMTSEQADALLQIEEMMKNDSTFNAVELFGLEIKAGLMSKEDLILIRDKMYNTYGEDMADSVAVSYTKQIYTNAGVDLDKLQHNYLMSTGAKMLLLALLMMAASIIVGLIASRVSAGLSVDLRSSLFKKVVSFSHTEMDKFSTSSLITRSTNDIQQIQMVVVMFLRMIAYAPILAIGGIFKVLSTTVSMTWIVGVAVIAVLCVVVVLMAIAMPKFKIMQKLIDNLNLIAREILTGLPVIRAFSREKYEEERFSKANMNLKNTQLFTNRVMTFMMPSMMLVMNAVTVLIIWVAAKHIDKGTLQVGQMTAFITYSMQIIMSFLMLTMISVMLPRAIISANRVEEVLQTESVIKDKTNTTMQKISKAEVKFNHVWFKYPDADEYVLEDIDLTAKPGEITAFIGSTGSGKSTLIHLIPRFYDVTEGSITIDGIDIRDMPQSTLRKDIGFVPQKGTLFSGTIESNLRFGNENASDEQIKKAASIAQAAEFIEEKPDKYQSEIAQGGDNVSGGQKQRLSIARAIAKDPKIFIFDDSFSALDFKTDAILRKELLKNISDATVFIVAQRISTIMNANQIIVLNEGKIVGKGTHRELLKTCEVYKQIALSQLSQSELDSNNTKNTDEREAK